MKFQKMGFCWFFVAITEGGKEMQIAKNFDTVKRRILQTFEILILKSLFVIWGDLISGKIA